MQELAECGEYQSVEVVHALDSGCGGVLQLRQVSKLFFSKAEVAFVFVSVLVSVFVFVFVFVEESFN